MTDMDDDGSPTMSVLGEVSYGMAFLRNLRNAVIS